MVMLCIWRPLPTLRYSSLAVANEVAVLERQDRVYSVAMSGNGKRVVVGGRDKAVCMYALDDVDRGVNKSAAENEPLGRRPRFPSRDLPELEVRELWEAPSDDFVYAVAVTANLQFCAYGGTAMSVVVLEGRSGQYMYEVACSGSIWSVTFLEKGKATTSTKMAFGGDFSDVVVVDLESRQAELTLPASDGVAYAVCVTADTVCYAQGSVCVAYGMGGTEYSWMDQPAYQHIAQLMQNSADGEDQMIKTVGAILERHPTVVNLRSRGDRGSLIELAIEQGENSRLLERLLEVKCHVGLLPTERPGRVTTAITAALDASRGGALRELLNALLDRRFQLTPATMALVAQSFSQLSSRYPREFIRLIANCPLHDEPEVLEGQQTHTVALASRLILGSERRCPKGLWRETIERMTDEPVTAARGRRTRAHERSCRADEPEPGAWAKRALAIPLSWCLRAHATPCARESGGARADGGGRAAVGGGVRALQGRAACCSRSF